MDSRRMMSWMVWGCWVGAQTPLDSCAAQTPADLHAAPERGVVVRIPASAARHVTDLGVQPRLSLDYGTFLWLEMSEADLGRLRASGLEYEMQTGPYTLRLGEQSFDPRVSEPVLPPGWDKVRSTGPDLHLVQFVGPTRAEWVESLERSGLHIIQYIEPFTYIVWGDAAARDSLKAATAVRWTGPFAPAYRVLPRWQDLPEERRQVKVLMVRFTDTDAVVRSLEALGGKLDGRTVRDDTFEVARFTLPGNAFQAAAQLPGVYSIQPVPTDGGLRGEMSDQVNVNNVDGSNQAFPGYQTWLTTVGLNGAGVIIANVDAGIQNNHPDLMNRLIACSGTTCGGGASDGHGTHTAGIMAADASSGVKDSYNFYRGLGVAPGANLVEQVYSPYYQQPNGMLLLMKDSYNNGASLSGNSWGPSGSPLGYDDDTKQVDIGVRDAVSTTPGNQPLSFILSVMNGYGGTSTQGTPDEAKNIFTIGSTKMQTSGGAQILQINDLSSNTAHGPALDGRTIPHLVAPGCSVDSTYTGSSYTLLCGTSMASPHVSGAVALFIQYYRNLPGTVGDPSPALIRAAFIAVAKDLAGNKDADNGTLGHPFDSKQGWGRMDLEAVVDPQVEANYFDNPVVFNNTGEEWSRSLTVLDPTQPLRVMLVWTDAPGHGLGGSTPAWNNNLDLLVDLGAATYRGNRFGATGWSITGGVADNKNNTEGVFVGPTASGPFTIRVQATNISSDAIPGVGDTTDQDFAVVCYNCHDTADCNGNGIPDDQDIAGGTSADCNGNGVPDECEPATDCNTNGIQDICDIAAGTAADCNGDGSIDACQALPDCNENGTPDLCETLADCNLNGTPDGCEPALDCNGNGTPDVCETLPDCNHNGQPDTCDIAYGTSTDCDETGVPDQCEAIGTVLRVSFETALPPGWSATGLWHSTNACGRPNTCDPTQWGYYGRDNACNFDTGSTTAGVLTSPPVYLPAGAPVTLTYCSAYAGEAGNSNLAGYDWAWVSANGDEVDDVSLAGNQTDWETRTVDLSAYAGQTVTFRWHFDSRDNLYNSDLGWQMDLIEVTGAGSFPDCNANGQLDACDIDFGVSRDCNGNNVPDECDLAAGTSEDCSANGTPDECEPIVTLLAAKSWKTHGSGADAEEFYMDLPLVSSGTTSPGAETRVGGITQLTFEFSGPPALPTPPTAVAVMRGVFHSPSSPLTATVVGNVLVTTWSGELRIPPTDRYVVCLSVPNLCGDRDVEIISQLGNVTQIPPPSQWKTDAYDKSAVAGMIGQPVTHVTCKYDVTQVPPPSAKKIDAYDLSTVAGAISPIQVSPSPVTCP